MPRISRNKLKERGILRFLRSFQYSMEGLIYSYKNEQSMLIHFIVTVFAVFLGFLFDITKTEWILIFLALSIILVAELFNTAIEAIVDLITLEVNPLAKIAKDCGSAATFVVSGVCFIVCAAVMYPYIIKLFFG